MDRRTVGRRAELAPGDRDHAYRRMWLRWATGVLVADMILHNALGTLVNDWEGWSAAAQVFIFVLITGLLIVGLTFGLLVRWGLRPSPRDRNRAALAAFGAGIASLASYAIFFTWAPVLIAPAALVLAREALRAAGERGGRGYALTGAALGVSSLGVFALFVVVALVTGDYPFGL